MHLISVNDLQIVCNTSCCSRVSLSVD